jgi:hypothetical protein
MWGGYDEVGMKDLETCDMCHNIYAIFTMVFDGKEILCPKCKE